jgi:hypothetical protein
MTISRDTAIYALEIARSFQMDGEAEKLRLRARGHYGFRDMDACFFDAMQAIVLHLHDDPHFCDCVAMPQG